MDLARVGICALLSDSQPLSAGSQSLKAKLALEGVLGVAAGIAPSLSSQDLIVVRAQVQPGLAPCRKVVGHRHGAAPGPLVDAVGNVLPERRRAYDGRLVDLLVLPNLVRGPVALKGAELLSLS